MCAGYVAQPSWPWGQRDSCDACFSKGAKWTEGPKSCYRTTKDTDKSLTRIRSATASGGELSRYSKLLVSRFHVNVVREGVSCVDWVKWFVSPVSRVACLVFNCSRLHTRAAVSWTN